jgi:cysteine desulfurase
MATISVSSASASQSPLIYLDHAATTPTDPRVVEVMLPYFSEFYGNPSSAHRFGRTADKALQSARRSIAQQLHCSPRELIFTGCGSESDNLALRGVLMAAIEHGERPHLLTTLIEHHAVSKTARQLAATLPCDVTFLPVDSFGMVTPDTLRQALTNASRTRQPATTLVSVMLGNNEVGTIQPVVELAAIAHEFGALFHTDAVQAAGQLPLDVKALGVDLLALAAHKFYGPKGVGLLYVREGVTLLPPQSGGGQEQDRRAGTQNVALIVGMATALDLAYTHFEARVAAYQARRDQIIDGVLSRLPYARLTGHPIQRLPNHASFVIEGIEGNTLLMHLDTHGVAAGTGSACNTGNPEPSEVLTAMGYPPELALGSLRLTVGQQTTAVDIDYMLDVLAISVEKLRKVRALQTI